MNFLLNCTVPGLEFSEQLTAAFETALNEKRQHDACYILSQNSNWIISLMGSNTKGSSAMHYAASNAYDDLLGYVLQIPEHGQVLLNSFDNRGNTPLMSAVLSKNTDTAKLLIKYGADVSLLDNFGETALSKAIKGQHYCLVELLAGLVPDFQWSIRDIENQSILRLAVESMYSFSRSHMCEKFEALRMDCPDANQVIQGMSQALASVNPTRDDGRKILNIVLQQYLLLPESDHEYMSCIRLACMNGDMRTLKIMLDK